MLSIKKTIEDGKAVFALTGRLDTTTAPELEAELTPSLDGVSELTLDLEGLEYVSSAGLRVFLAAQKVMNRQGSMLVRHAKEPVMEVFEVTGFSNSLTLV